MDGERIIIGFNREAGIAIIGDSATATDKTFRATYRATRR
jgi:hypothetical protein